VKQAHIGIATMEVNGTITLRLRATGQGRIMAMANYSVRPCTHSTS
jgi:hypothetical protein